MILGKMAIASIFFSLVPITDAHVSMIVKKRMMNENYPMVCDMITVNITQPL